VNAANESSAFLASAVPPRVPPSTPASNVGSPFLRGPPLNRNCVVRSSAGVTATQAHSRSLWTTHNTLHNLRPYEYVCVCVFFISIQCAACFSRASNRSIVETASTTAVVYNQGVVKCTDGSRQRASNVFSARQLDDSVIEDHVSTQDSDAAKLRNKAPLPAAPSAGFLKAFISDEFTFQPPRNIDELFNTMQTDVAPPALIQAVTAVNGKKWECDTCMVMNEPNDAKCVCCTEPRRVVATAVTASAASQLLGKWTRCVCNVCS
jgi:hypothetical protein